MREFIKSYRGITAQYPAMLDRGLKREWEGCGPSTKIDHKVLPDLFWAYEASCDAEYVREGDTTYTDEALEEDLLGKQVVVFGYKGRGLIGGWYIKSGESANLENVFSFVIFARFDLRNIEAPAEPFFQLRLMEIIDNEIVLGEVHLFKKDADAVAGMLAGNYLEMIAYKSIKGYLPGMEYKNFSK